MYGKAKDDSKGFSILKLVGIEEAEARLQRVVDVQALFLGLLIGIAVSFLVQLATMPIQSRLTDGRIEFYLGTRILSVMEAQAYYIMLGIITIVVAALAISKARGIYGLSDQIQMSIDHQEDRTKLAERLRPKLESVGNTYGYGVTSRYEADAKAFVIDFTPPGSTEAALTVMTTDTRVALTTRIDRGLIELAKDVRTRIAETVSTPRPYVVLFTVGATKDNLIGERLVVLPDLKRAHWMGPLTDRLTKEGKLSTTTAYGEDQVKWSRAHGYGDPIQSEPTRDQLMRFFPDLEVAIF